MSSEDGKKSGGVITTLHLQCRCSLGKNRIWSSNNILLQLPPPPRAVCVCVWLFMPPERIVGMN